MQSLKRNLRGVGRPSQCTPYLINTKNVDDTVFGCVWNSVRLDTMGLLEGQVITKILSEIST